MTAPRVVFDSNLFPPAASNPDGAAGACFHYVKEGKAVLYTSPETLKEARDILHKEDLQQRLGLTPQRADMFLREVEAGARIVKEVPARFQFPERDPDDHKFPNLAHATDAHYLVTKNKRDFSPLRDDPEFKKHFPNLQIVTPWQFLTQMRERERKAEVGQDKHVEKSEGERPLRQAKPELAPRQDRGSLGATETSSVRGHKPTYEIELPSGKTVPVAFASNVAPGRLPGEVELTTKQVAELERMPAGKEAVLEVDTAPARRQPPQQDHAKPQQQLGQPDTPKTPGLQQQHGLKLER